MGRGKPLPYVIMTSPSLYTVTNRIRYGNKKLCRLFKGIARRAEFQSQHHDSLFVAKSRTASEIYGAAKRRLFGKQRGAKIQRDPQIPSLRFFRTPRIHQNLQLCRSLSAVCTAGTKYVPFCGLLRPPTQIDHPRDLRIGGQHFR